MGTALSNFTDFVKATGPAYLTGPETFINEAVKTTYTLPYMLKGKGMDKVIQGGDRIFDDIMLDDASTFTEYNPNQEFNWSMPQVVTEHQIDWRFAMDHMAWTEQTIILNGGDMGSKTRSAQAQTYLRMRKKIEQRMWTSMLNGIEGQIWADANSATGDMEAQTGKKPYSIPALITEDTTAYHATGWTNVAGINPATESKWRNQVETYDYDDADDTDGDGDGLIDAFDNMWTDVDFQPPGMHNEHFEGPYSSDRQVIFCSKGGLNQYKRLLRASNDTLVQKTDAAYNNVTFSGIKVARIAALDTLSMIWNATTAGTAGTETGYTTDGYRYFWINGNYTTPVFHTTKYFDKKAPYHLPNQPWSWVCPVDVWWNLFCQSRQRQGIVAPQA